MRDDGSEAQRTDTDRRDDANPNDKNRSPTRMDDAAVADYLRQHPRFFEEHGDVVADIFVPHPHGGHAIPLAERQILALRDKNAELEAKLRELIRFGTENDAIGEKLHRATLALFAAPDLETTLAVLYHSLKEDFAVPQVAARLWGKVPEQSYLPELAATSPEVRSYAEHLGAPYCGSAAAFDTRDWFEGGEGLASFAYLPLRTVHTFGLLALASGDPERFHPGMGTLYVTRLAELASVAAARFLPPG
jgi:uncharacterized protein YigA (DUF484 family)